MLINFTQRYLLELIFSQFTLLSYFWAILMVIWTLYTNDRLQYFRSYLSIFYHYVSEEYVKLIRLLDVLPSKAKWASSHLYSNVVSILVRYIYFCPDTGFISRGICHYINYPKLAAIFSKNYTRKVYTSFCVNK